MNIRVENLTKTYGNQKAIDNISFDVNKGEIVGFLGPNGAGKTTTMKILTGFLAPSDGEVFIGDEKLSAENIDSLKRKIGYLPESNPLYYDMAVTDYLRYCGELQKIPKSEIDERIISMIRLTGLDREKHKLIGELSKGYKQRVGLAQAMIHDPEILILDEPTTGLDPNQIVEIRKLIRELGQQKTVILSTHILPEVEATCDRILIINKGEIVADGSSESLRKQSQGNEILTLRIEEADINDIFIALQSLPNAALVDFIDKTRNRFEFQSRPETSSARDIFQLCVDKGWYLTELTPTDTKLEDIFRNLTLN